MLTQRLARRAVLSALLLGGAAALLLLTDAGRGGRDAPRAAAATALNAGLLSATSARLSAGQAPPAVLVISHPRLPLPDLTGVPGAVPRPLIRVFNDAWRGWPVWPLHRQHAVRGDLNETRSRFHFGIDISVNDARPEPGAPRGRTHRVYAIESGLLRYGDVVGVVACQNRHFWIGHFDYWHVDPTLPNFTHVRAGQPIGWTCLGEWHVHVAEYQNGMYINPLLPGSKIAPYRDQFPPRVGWLRFYGPEPTRFAPESPAALAAPDGAAPLLPQALHGFVDARLEAGVPQFWRALPQIFRTERQPFAIALRIAPDRRGAAPVVRRVVFVNERLLDGVVPLIAHFAPGTSPDRPAHPCDMKRTIYACRPIYVYRLFARPGGSYLWDTTRVADGPYRVTVTLWDLAGNSTRATTVVQVANRHLPARRNGIQLRLFDAFRTGSPEAG